MLKLIFIPIFIFLGLNSVSSQSTSQIYNVNLIIEGLPVVDSIPVDSLVNNLDTTVIQDVRLIFLFSLSDTTQTDTVFYTLESNNIILFSQSFDIGHLITSDFPIERNKNRFRITLGIYSGSNFKIKTYIKDINGNNSVIRVYPDDL